MRVIVFFIALFVCALAQDTSVRSYDGTNNNINNPNWGAAGIPLVRKLPIKFQDGISIPTGGMPSVLPSPRLISNLIVARQPEYDIAADQVTSLMMTFWGQFIDHDISITFDSNTSFIGSKCNPFPIPIPKGDSFYDSGWLGGQTMGFCRAVPSNNTGTSTTNPMQFPNFITSWIDGNQVYGQSTARANALRTFSGGLMKTSPGVDGDYLPLNNNGNGGKLVDMVNPANKVPALQLYAAGDFRANENPILLSLHTVFVREHNRRAKLLANSGLNDESIFQQARLMVIAHIQKITYEDFLPIVIGSQLPAYQGYNASANPSCTEFFSTVAFRFGHDTLSDVLPRLDPQGQSIPQGSVLLRDSFFDIASFNAFGAGVFLRGASVEPQRPVDSIFEEDVRTFLYGTGPLVATDLSARNIQRARDMGLGFYNDARAAYGLPTCNTFSCVNSDPNIVALLNQIYGQDNVTYLDCFIGGLLEPKLPNAKLGALFSAALSDQFGRARDGDRFWYQNPGVLTAAQLSEIESTTLGQIILRNTDSTTMPPDVFNRAQGVDPSQVFNPPNNTPWIIGIVILSVVAGILIIVVIGLCFSRSKSSSSVNNNDSQLYTNLMSEEKY